MTQLYSHLMRRGLNPKDYAVHLDEDEMVATFMLFNLNGKITGYQQYRPLSTEKKVNDPKLGRYYTYTPRGIDAILGLETDTGEGPLFMVEGVFKQAAVRNAGFNCVSPLGSDPKRLRPLFRILRKTRPVIAIGDPDPAGEKFVRRVGFGETSRIDLDEMPRYEVQRVCEKLVKEYHA